MRAHVGGTDSGAATALPAADRLRTLFEVHYASLVALGRLLVDDRGLAEELVQEAFIRLQPRLDRVENAPAYLHTCVVNGARSALRRRRTAQTFLRRQRPDEAYAEPTRLVEDREAVLAVLKTLPGRQREVLALRYLLDLSEKEIADTLGISAGSVKTHASRGLASGAAALGETIAPRGEAPAPGETATRGEATAPGEATALGGVES